MTLPLDQLAARVDRGLDRVGAIREQRWRHKGGVSALERWSLRHPLLSSATAVLVAVALLGGLEGLRALLAGDVAFSGSFGVLVAIVVVVCWPLAYRIQRHAATRYQAWHPPGGRPG